jgi:hypothetical protein
LNQPHICPQGNGQTSRFDNSAGTSAYSEVAQTSTLAGTTPAAPSGLTVTTISSSALQLVWLDNSSNETGFAIERSLDGVSFSGLTSVGANATAFTDSSLPAGATYYYRVRADNQYGSSTYTLTVNGTPVDVAAAGWQWDHDFGKFDIAALIKHGENIVDFTVAYDFLTEVEPAYIVGDFGVQLVNTYRGMLIEESTQIANGTWLTQGFPFYSGSMIYRTTFTSPHTPGTRTFLRLNRASGILFKVRLNGAEAGSILWEPHLLELTNGVRYGESVLEIEVVSSRQNTLGPLHEIEGDNNRWVGPNAFEDEWEVREAFSLFDYGLLGGAEIVTLNA